MLKALSNLSTIGTKVISQSKTATVDSLKALAPTLTKIAQASGDSFPKALQVFLTYPFVDAVVGKNPAVARNLHMGDYTNLNIQLDINLNGLGAICSTLPQLQDLPVNICDNPQLESCVNGLLKTDPNQFDGKSVEDLLATLINQCGAGLKTTLCDAAKGLPGPLGSTLGDLCGIPVGGLKVPRLPIKVPSLSKLTKCLSSGKPLGAACDKINPLLLAQRCSFTTKRDKPKGYRSDTCKRYRELNLRLNKNGDLIKLPIGGGGGNGGNGGGGGDPLGLPGLGRRGFGANSTSHGVAARGSHDNDLTSMLVWGLMSR